VVGENEMKRWHIQFDQNAGEYTGNLVVTANKICLDKQNLNAFTADGVYIEIDERIISLEKLPIRKPARRGKSDGDEQIKRQSK
jgi:hypothetical protein